MDPQSENQRMVDLRDAVLSIGDSLSLAETLQHVVSAASRLAGARYAALGVPDEQGERLVEFITHGLSRQAEAAIPERPRGHGLLGVMLHEGRSLRLRDLRQHPRSVGFPPKHPPMTSFLGVPLLYQGKLLGDLYLCDKLGADEFSEADQALIELLATHAAQAIHNARLHQAAMEREHELERRNQELSALNAVITATSRSLSLQNVLDEALHHVRAVYGAEAGDVYLVDEASGDLVLALHQGPLPEPFLKASRIARGQGIVGEVVETGEMRSLSHLDQNRMFVRRAVLDAGFRTMVCVPLRAKDHVVGVLDLFARDPSRFSDFNPALLTLICNQVGIAAENARLHEQVAGLAVSQERQRIGMDLHDGVIQSIYAAGLSLELGLAQAGEGDVAGAQAQMRGAIQALNTTIHDIRAYLMALRPRRFEGTDLVTALERLLVEYRANTQMAVDFSADRALETELTLEARSTLFHIAQEALSNAARHSRATRLVVRLYGLEDSLVFCLSDNGCGIKRAGVDRPVGHGLRNMRDRARALGGDVAVSSEGGAGTEVRVTLPRLGLGAGRAHKQASSPAVNRI